MTNNKAVGYYVHRDEADRMDVQNLTLPSLIRLVTDFPHLKPRFKNLIDAKLEDSKCLSVWSQRMFFDEEVVAPIKVSNPEEGYELLMRCASFLDSIDISFEKNQELEISAENEKPNPLTYIYIGGEEVVVKDMLISRILLTLARHVTDVRIIGITLFFDSFYMAHITRLLAESRCLQRLFLMNVTMCLDMWQKISSTTTQLCLRNNRLLSYPVLRQLVNLTSVVIDIDLEELCVLLRDLGKNCPKLQSLHIKYKFKMTEIRKEVKEDKALPIIRQNYRRFRNLRVLKMENFWIKLDKTVIKIILITCCQVQTLILNVSSTTARYLLALLRHMRRLETLELYGCRVVNHMLRPWPIPWLKKLKLLRSARISLQGIINLLAACSNLVVFELRKLDFNMGIFAFCIKLALDRQVRLSLRITAIFKEIVIEVCDPTINYTTDKYFQVLYSNNNQVTNYANAIILYLQTIHPNLIVKQTVILKDKDQLTKSTSNL